MVMLPKGYGRMSVVVSRVYYTANNDTGGIFLKRTLYLVKCYYLAKIVMFQLHFATVNDRN